MIGKKTLGWVIGIVVVIALIGGLAISQKTKQTDFPMAPLFTEPTVFGDGTVRLEAYRGKVVFVNFWATWCPPCRAEIPDLIRLHQDYADRLVIIGVSVDRGPDAQKLVQNFVKEFGMSYPVIMGNDLLVNRYGGISAIPTSFVIDKQGRIVEKIVGMRNYSTFLDAVKKWF